MTYTFKLNGEVYKVDLDENDNEIVVEINGDQHPVEFSKIDNNFYSLIVDGESLTIAVSKKGKHLQVFYEGQLYELESISDRDKAKAGGAGSGLQITAPMPSRVVKLLKAEGDDVEAGEGVVVVEAMKMESELKAESTGKIKEINVAEGDSVEANAVLVVLSND